MSGLAHRLKGSGKLPDAVKLFRQIVELCPTSAGYVHLAVALADSGLARDALEALDEAMALAPDDPLCGSIRAVILADENRIEDAELAASICLESFSTNPMVVASNLYVGLAKGDTVACLRTLAESPICDNGFFRSRILFKIEKIVQKCEGSLSSEEANNHRSTLNVEDNVRAAGLGDKVSRWLRGKSPKQRAEMAFRRGSRLFESGRNEEAVVLLEEAVSADPDMEKARLYLGCALFEAEEYERACSLLQPLASEDEGMAAFYYGASLCKTGRFAEALEVLDIVAAGQSSFDFQEWLHYFRALALIGTGERAEAIRELVAVSEFSWTFLQERAKDALRMIDEPRVV